MGVQWDNTSAIYRLQESLWLSEEGSILEFFSIEFGVAMKLIKIWLNETYSKARIGKYVSDSFSI
jgi:hypothetical protein